MDLQDPFTLFIAQVVVILLVARTLGLVTRAVGQPMVVAEIIAGILLGPSVLGALLPAESAVLFAPGSLDALSLVSQLGLILFMFLIGVELDPKLLRQEGRTSAVISLTGVVATFGLGAILAVYLHPIVAGPRVSFLTFTLFFGAAMTITAFPVLARILTERGLLRSRVGTITVTCAAIDDVVAWSLFAVVVALTRAGDFETVALATLFPVGYVAVVLFVVRPLLARFAARLGGRARLSHDVVAAFMLLLFASCWAAELAGIHALFGAFLFGAILPRHEGLAHGLAEKLEDVVLVVLLPLFFAYSGLRTDIQLMDTPAAWLLCGLILLVASLGKLGGNALAARLTGLSWRDSGALGVLMNTRGLMALAVLNIGLDLGVVSPTLFTMMVVVALATTLMATPLLDLLYPPGELAREVLARTGAEPTAAAPNPDAFLILACLPEGGGAGPALMTVAAAVRTPGDREPVRALMLTPPSDRTSFYLAARSQAASDDELEPLLERARALDLPVRPIAFVSPQPARAICNMAEAIGAALVLVGWHRPLIAGSLLGGTVYQVLRDAPAAVGVFIDRGLEEVRRVLVPFVGTAHDYAALALAKRFGERGAEITLLHVKHPDDPAEARRAAAELADQTFPGPSGARLCLKVVHDASPVDVAVAEAWKGYDLVVVGVGREWGLEQRRLGVHSERFMREAPASMLIVRGVAAPAPATALLPQGAIPARSR